MNIVCIGGGPAGLYFALLMKQQNPAHCIAVVERNRPYDTFGWGVVFSDATMDNMRVWDPVTAYQIVSMAEGVVQRGTATVVNSLGFPLGGKTGKMLPASPMVLEDFTFFNSQVIADLAYPAFLLHFAQHLADDGDPAPALCRRQRAQGRGQPVAVRLRACQPRRRRCATVLLC